MNTPTTPVETDTLVKVRVELTETRLLTKYYDIAASDLPHNWNSMSPDEQYTWMNNIGHFRKNTVDEIQERTDGVFLSWEKSHPEWTVTFTYTNTEIVSAPNRETAIARARELIAGTFQPQQREGAAQLLGDADVDVIDGRWGL